MSDPKRILVLCTGNSCRSQMAEGFLRSFDPALEVRSAGTFPAERVHPNAVRVMREAGIDISGGRPKDVAEFLGQSFFAVITVCDDADRNCPVFQGQVEHRLHMPFDDPAKATGSDEQVIERFREAREKIRRGFREFYDSKIQKG